MIGVNHRVFLLFPVNIDIFTDGMESEHIISALTLITLPRETRAVRSRKVLL